MSHLKTLVSPKSWPTGRKTKVFVARPSSGPHAIMRCITPNVLLQELLKITKTRKETRQVLREGNFLIDQRKREDYKFPVGLFDIISLPVTKEDFVLIYDTKGKFQLHKIKSENAKTKLCKIVGKTMLKGKKTQLNISGGCNIIIDKDTYKVGDSVKLSIPDLKIKGHIKFEKGASVYLVGGKHVGKTGKIEEIKKLGVEEDRIIIKTKDDKIETLKNYSIVIEDGLL